MCGMACFETSAVPITFTPSTFCQSATSACSTLFCVKSAALLTRMSMPPKLPAALAEIARAPASWEMSATTRTACAPRSRTFWSVAWRRRLADVVEHQARAFFGETKRDGFSDAGADAGDDGSLVREPHARLLRKGHGREIAAGHDLVDHAVLDALVRAHDVVAIHVARDPVYRLPCEVRQDLV